MSNPDANFGVVKQPLTGPYDYTWSRVDPKGEFGNKDRAYRAGWLKEQKLSPRDGWLFVTDNPDYRRARFNVFRRIWQWPMDRFEAAMAKRMPVLRASNIRLFVAMTLRCYVTMVAGYYFFFHHDQGSWMVQDTCRVFKKREEIYPGDPRWPNKMELKRTPQDFGHFGFKDFDSTLFKSSFAQIENKAQQNV